MNRLVSLAVIRSPSMTDEEVVKYSANRSLSQDVIREIAGAKEWTKIHTVRANLVNNPKCPLPSAMRLLPLLHEKDIRMVAKSRSVPSAVVNQARHLLEAKDGTKRK
jgi:hypothetical protein